MPDEILSQHVSKCLLKLLSCNKYSLFLPEMNESYFRVLPQFGNTYYYYSSKKILFLIKIEIYFMSSKLKHSQDACCYVYLCDSEIYVILFKVKTILFKRHF